MLEIVIDNKDGSLWDISGIVSVLNYKTTRIGRAASVEFSFLKGGLYEAKEFKYDVGDVIRIRFDDAPVFMGYVFTIDSGRDEEVKIIAYDQVRYLMVNEYIQKTNFSATEVVKYFADRLKLKTSDMMDTGYKIPKLREDGVKAIDIIHSALQDTSLATGIQYVFYDDFGELTLKKASDLIADFYLGDTSLMVDYKMKSSIEDAYNMVILTKDNEVTGKRELYGEQDSGNIAKWGLLKLVQSVDSKMNAAQMDRTLKNLMQQKNRVGRTFTVEALGDIRLRAGHTLSIAIEEVGINQQFMINGCMHKFDGTDHTMLLELIDIRTGDKKVTVVT